MTYPKRLAEDARRRASQVQGGEMDPAGGLEASWRERLRDARAWSRVADRFVMEWQMAGKEIVFGFIVLGLRRFKPEAAGTRCVPGGRMTLTLGAR